MVFRAKMYPDEVNGKLFVSYRALRVVILTTATGQTKFGYLDLSEQGLFEYVILHRYGFDYWDDRGFAPK